MATLKKSNNRKPLGIMLAMGTDDHEILRCLEKTRNKLILSKEKIQNLPKNKNAALELLSTFNPKSISIITEWFKNNIDFSSLPTYTKSITILKNTPINQLDSEEFKTEWRSIFSAYCDIKTHGKINEFLASIEANNTLKNKIDAKPETTTKDSKSNNKTSLLISKDEILNYITKIKANDEFISENLYLNFIDGIISAHFSIDSKLNKVKEILKKENSDISVEFLELIESIEKQKNEKYSHKKGTISKKQAGEIDPENNLVVAEVINILPNGQFFAKVIGTLVNDKLIEYVGEESKEIYPQTGDITAYPKTINGNRHIGEIALWKVEHKRTDKKTQFVITELASRTYEIVSIPHSSKEPDSIREWLQKIYSQDGNHLPIFELDDGVLIKVPGESVDLKFYNFEKPLDILKSITEYQLKNGKRIVTPPLPSSKLKLDCSPAINSIKKILKFSNLQSEFPQFSHSQIKSFSDFIQNQAEIPHESNLKRALDELTNSVTSRDFINSTIEDLIKLPLISDELESEKSKILSAYEEEIKSNRKELKNIEDEKNKILSSISDLKTKSRSIENELSKNIKQVFEKSKANGISTLSDVALFQSFLFPSIDYFKNNNENKIAPSNDSNLSFLNDIKIGKTLETSKSTLLSIEEACFYSGLSLDLLKIVLASSVVCGAVALTGRKKKLLVNTVRQIFAHGIGCRVAVSGDIFSFSDLLRLPATVTYAGHSSGMSLGEFLKVQSEAKRSSVIEFVGVNRAPPESFVPDLLEMVRSITSGSSIAWLDVRGNINSVSIEAPIISIFEFVTGGSTFAFDKNLASEFPILDTDFKWGNESAPEKISDIRLSTLTIKAISELYEPTSYSTETIELSDELARCFNNLKIVDSKQLSSTLLYAGRPKYNQSDNRMQLSEKFLMLSKSIHSISDSIFVDPQKRN